MTLPAEVLVHAMQLESDPVKAAKLILKYAAKRDRVAARKAKAAAIMLAAKKQVAELMHDDICEHDVRKAHCDPSGNGDTAYECLICGEWLYEKAVRFT